MSRRTRTLSVSSALAAIIAVACLSIPVKYVALGPGETDDTLGAEPGSPMQQVLQVTGAPTYPTTGQLRLTTVSVSTTLTLGQALERWVQKSYAVVPESVIYPPQTPKAKVDQQNVQDMVTSQDDATLAAISELLPPKVMSFTAGSKAGAALQVGDVVTAVDGTPVSALPGLRAAVAALKPGDLAKLTVLRGGASVDVSVTTIGVTDGSATRTILGFQPDETSPVKVTINLQNIGGPSAGMMFALGIIDKLTPGDLTAGRVIAGTGEITATGDVGLIGGIQQKLQGARYPVRSGQAPATVFLVPSENCAEAAAAHVSGLQLVRIPAIGGLDAAYQDLQKLAKGDTDLPSC